MKLLLSLYLTITIVVTSNAQHKGDYNWIFGYDYTDSLPGTEGTVIDFNNRPPSIEYQPIFPSQAMGNSVSVMSHPESGELLFYSNGCNVFDASHNRMHNGDDINPGMYRDYYCEEEGTQWYPILGTLLSIEDAYHPDKYYFLHSPIQWTEEGKLFCDRLMYSYIDMTKNNKLGEVVEKNEIYYQSDVDINCAYTSVVRHANGKDWWIIHPEENSNRLLTFLIDSTGPHYITTQELGETIVKQGRATFSPNGEILGFFNDNDGYYQYDFDRETGLLSNSKHISLQQSGLGGGLAYSPSSEFVYLFYRDKIFQLETQSEDLNDEAVLIDTLILFGDGKSSSFSHGQLGPDCKIYITHRSGVGYLGVINNPDEKGVACDLDQRGLDLVYFHVILSIPNFPPFRVDEEEKCDNTIVGLFPEVIRQNASYFVYYPNPTEDELKILPSSDGDYTITNTVGHVIREGAFKSDVETALSLVGLSSGIYYINMIRGGEIVQSEQLVKI